MAAVTGAIWKCATDSYENVERFEELDLVKLLVQILKVLRLISKFSYFIVYHTNIDINRFGIAY